MGARITTAFARYGWCAAIRGVEGGGLVESLPTHTFSTEDGDVALKCPTETLITDRREKELADLKAEGRTIMPCVSRFAGKMLVLNR